MMFDGAGLNRRAIREALEFIAAHQDEIRRRDRPSSSSSTRCVLREAGRIRTQLMDSAEQAFKGETGSSQERVTDPVVAKARYLRRALAPLSVDQLARELAGVLRSDASVEAKVVATEIAREQADLRAAQKRLPAPNRAVANRLLAQVRRTLEDAEAEAEEAQPVPHASEADSPPPPTPVESAPPAADTPSEGGQAGIDDLIAAIQEEGEQTRKTLREEGEKTRKTIESSGRRRGKVNLLLGLATVLISFASLYMPTSGSPSPPQHGSTESTPKIQGPLVPSAAGPPASGPRLGSSLNFPRHRRRTASGSASLRAR